MNSPRSTLVVIPAALLAALTLAGAAAPAPADKGVRLRYGLQPSTGYDQQGTVALDLKVDPSTLPASMAMLAKTALGDVRQEITIKGRLDVHARASDGSTPFTFTIVDATGTLLRGETTKPLNAVSRMVGRPPIEGRFTADGRRVEIPPTANDPAGRPDRARDQLAQSLPDLPEGALNVGQSFEARLPIILPGAGGSGEDRVEARWVYTLKGIEPGRARFDVRQVLPQATASMPQGRSLTMSGGATGSAVFDLTEGLFTEIHLDTDMAMNLQMKMPPGLVAPGTAPGGAPATGGAATGGAPAANGAAPDTLSASMLTLGSKVTGPIAMTMSRAAAPAVPAAN